jgi:hypothetical protein
MDSFHAERFKALPRDIRDRALAVYEKELSESDKEWTRNEFAEHGDDWWVIDRWHFEGGMYARNLLREAGLSDDLLPGGTWDDYYIQLIEVWAGIREIGDF